MLQPDQEQRFAPIQISYREEGKHRGKGSFYDHWTFRLRTNHHTTVTLPNGWNTNLLANFNQTTVLSLAFNNPKWLQVPVVQDINQHEEHGLLVIPGRARETVGDEARMNHEQAMIRDALLRGRPVLSICAGSWQLWKALGKMARGWEVDQQGQALFAGGGLVDVVDHNHGSGMPRLPTGMNNKITHNGLVHRVNISENSMLAKAMLGQEGFSDFMQDVPVNSVHWQAPDENDPPQLNLFNGQNNVNISATCVQDNNIAPNSRQGHQMQPTHEAVEGFDLKHGAPTLGVLWHPEAFNEDDVDRLPHLQVGMLRFMSFAGDAYRAKQRMLVELRQHPNFANEQNEDDDIVHGIQGLNLNNGY